MTKKVVININDPTQLSEQNKQRLALALAAFAQQEKLILTTFEQDDNGPATPVKINFDGQEEEIFLGTHEWDAEAMERVFVPTELAKVPVTNGQPSSGQYRYKVLNQRLGSGAYGTVYRSDAELGVTADNPPNLTISKKVEAVKVGFKQKQQDLEQEFRALRTVHGEHKTQLLFHGKDSVLTMPYFKGKSLHTSDFQTEPLNFLERFYFMVAVLEELDDLHEKGLVHRDVKGVNYLFDTVTGTAKLVDLGMAEGMLPPGAIMPKDQPPLTARLHGTWQYVAPEVVDAKQQNNQSLITAKTDAFAVAALIAELFGAKNPGGLRRKTFKQAEEAKREEKLTAAIPNWRKLSPKQLDEQIKAKNLTLDRAEVDFTAFKQMPYDFNGMFTQVGTTPPNDEVRNLILNIAKQLSDPDPNKRPELKAVLKQLYPLQEQYLQQSAEVLESTILQAIHQFEQYIAQRANEPADVHKVGALTLLNQSLWQMKSELQEARANFKNKSSNESLAGTRARHKQMKEEYERIYNKLVSHINLAANDPDINTFKDTTFKTALRTLTRPMSLIVGALTFNKDWFWHGFGFHAGTTATAQFVQDVARGTVLPAYRKINEDTPGARFQPQEEDGEGEGSIRPPGQHL